MGPAFAVIMLICSAGISVSNCDADTATDVVRGPDANSIFDCGFTGEAMIASTALGPGLGKDQYLKIVCADKHHLPKMTELHAPAGPFLPADEAPDSVADAKP